MSPTHDYVIANGTGSSVRSNINDALAAVVSQNSSSTAPATTYAYMIWVDTTTNIVKMRNGANSAWIELFETDGELGSKTFNGNITLNAQGDLRFADSDSSNWVAFQAPATVASNVTWTLPSADGTANQTLITNGSGTLSWATPTSTSDKITEGNTEAEVVDTGSDGHFKVTTEGTERFRCDSSGRLLLGMSSARANFFNVGDGAGFQVEGTQASLNVNIAHIFGHTGAYGPNFIFAKHRSSSVGGTTVVAADDPLGSVSFQGSDGTDFVEAASITARVDGTPGANDMPGRLVFSTTADGASSPTERMRLTNDGYMRLGDGTTYYHTIRGAGGNEALEFTANAGQQNASTAGTIKFLNSDTGGAITERLRIASSGVIFTYSADDSIRLGTSNGAGTTYALIRGYYSRTGINTGGTGSFVVWSNGNVQNDNNSYTGLSDIKLKENVVDANSQWDDIKALQVRNYNFKEGQTHRQIGLIAQEVEPICPGLVYESPDRDADGNDLGTVTKSVNYSVLYMKAVKALQEAMERIETLEASNADLAARLTALEAN